MIRMAQQTGKIIGSKPEILNDPVVQRMPRGGTPANTDRMKEIVDQFGWPGKSLVGSQARTCRPGCSCSNADHDPRVFKNAGLTLIAEAVQSRRGRPGKIWRI